MSRSRNRPRTAGFVLSALVLTAVTLIVPSPVAGSGAVAEHGASYAAVSAKPRQTAAQAARRAVRVAVQQARRGAPIPRRTTPRLAGVERNVASLGGCEYGEHSGDAGGRLCPRGDRTADRVLVVIGDSHGKHWVTGFQRAAKRYGWTAYYLVKEQCTASMVAIADPGDARPTKPWAACQDFREFAVQTVDDLDADLVVVSTSVPSSGIFTARGYVDDPQRMVAPFRAGFRTLFQGLRQATDGRIVLLRDVPARRRGTDPVACFRKRGNDLGDCLSPQNGQTGRTKLVDASVAAARSTGVAVVDPTSFFCWHGACPASIGRGLLPYRNTSHLTTTYAARLSKALADVLKLR